MREGLYVKRICLTPLPFTCQGARIASAISWGFFYPNAVVRMQFLLLLYSDALMAGGDCRFLCLCDTNWYATMVKWL